MNSTSTLAFVDVSKSFSSVGHTTVILSQISYTFAEGRTYAIMGVSGTGKSTLLYLLAGFEYPTKGTVAFNGVSLNQFSQKNREHFLNRHVGFLFPSPGLIHELTVIENVMLKGLIAGMAYDSCREKAYLLLERVGLTHKATVLPAFLSTGEAQRVAFLRALFLEPRFLLADEPTAHLDENNKKVIVDLLIEYQQSLSMCLIVCTYDFEVAKRMDTVLNLEGGRLLECTT